MHRTNLYLTEAQEQALDARARAEGVSRSAVVREILDRELGRRPALTVDDENTLAAVAAAYHDTIAGLFDDDPDLRIDT